MSNTKAVEQYIEEIKNRLADITPGPWEVEGGGGACVWHLGSGDTICEVNFDHQTGDHQPGEDQAFIANAPSDIAFLLDQLSSIPSQIEAAVQAEREACLRSGNDVMAWVIERHGVGTHTDVVSRYAAAIRARGEASNG